ncbi:MAG: hypothetical protein Q4G46_00005, partial [Propionibacteriaceae bacterium]|nr:hypothetical protein [Propionibacteriaceae bacterium]
MTTDATAVRQLLDLGAVTGEPADTSVPMVATQWSHPALPGRTVVRLTAEPLVRAEELSLEVTGFAPGPRTNVGHTRRRAIGFPAWPIIHDPANAHHALNIVADLERMARTARSKPGFAKDQVDDLVRILDATAPHFLPTLLEEAGRIFRRFDNPTYAAQMFAKARETERRHNLPIDPERHAEVFLEFAYAGALPVKELTAEATRLGQLTDPAQAYADFRTLSIERVRGGLEPYANMAKDLRKLAKAAGLDAATEDRRVAADLLQTPVINKAGTHFWKAYDKAITQLTADDADIRARELSLTPDAFGLDEWLERLEAWGALGRVIATNDVAFFRRMVTWLQTFGAWNRQGAPTPRLMELAEELAPALIASGEPVVLSRTRLAMVPADTLDKFAALGLPLALEGDKNGWTQINLRDWGDQAERGDLAHLAGLQEFAEAFAQGFDNAYSEHGAALSQAAGTRPMVLARIAQAVKDTAVRPLSLGTLARVWNSLLAPVAEVDEPEIRAGLAQVRDQIDGPQLLADNLRFGTLAELTWPEVEEAYAAEAAKLARQQRNQFYSFGPDVEMSWPELFLAGTLFGAADSPRALVAPTAKATLENAIVVGEEVALEWRDPDNRNLVWAWSRDPGTTYEKEWRYLSWDVRVPMHVSLVTDQGRLFASGLMRPGED